MSITGPGTDVNDVKALIDEAADRGKLRKDEIRGSGETGEGQLVGMESARWWEGG